MRHSIDTVTRAALDFSRVPGGNADLKRAASGQYYVSHSNGCCYIIAEANCVMLRPRASQHDR